MQNSLRAKTVVQPGGRIQFDIPELAEGIEVDVTVVPSVHDAAKGNAGAIGDFLRSLPPVKRTEAEWLQRDREFEEDRNEWDK